MTVEGRAPVGYGTLKSSRRDKAGKRASASSDRTVDVGQLEEFETMYNSWRHTLGILCLAVTVVLWTASNFLASDIFADNTYKKPYFITYINTAVFLLPLIPIAVVKLVRDPSSVRALLPRRRGDYTSLTSSNTNPTGPPDRRRSSFNPFSSTGKLSLGATAKLALEFCLLWFVANYLVAACLSYTTVASATLLTSTSSIFTLLFSAASRVERFTAPKLAAVLACLVGVALTTSSDWRSSDDAGGGRASQPSRGTFPHKTARELTLGNAMALASAACYGAYAVLLKRRIGDESRVDMLLFFGLVGVWNVLLLWPGLVALHFAGVEDFALPQSRHVAGVVLANAASSLVADVTWAFAMLFTSPLLVTVGLSLTIPLSLVGQIVIDRQYASAVYWLGAMVVVGSFLFINVVEVKEEEAAADAVPGGLLAAQPDEEADAERER